MCWCMGDLVFVIRSTLVIYLPTKDTKMVEFHSFLFACFVASLKFLDVNLVSIFYLSILIVDLHFIHSFDQSKFYGKCRTFSQLAESLYISTVFMNDLLTYREA